MEVASSHQACVCHAFTAPDQCRRVQIVALVVFSLCIAAASVYVFVKGSTLQHHSLVYLSGVSLATLSAVIMAFAIRLYLCKETPRQNEKETSLKLQNNAPIPTDFVGTQPFSNLLSTVAQLSHMAHHIAASEEDSDGEEIVAVSYQIRPNERDLIQGLSLEDYLQQVRALSYHWEKREPTEEGMMIHKISYYAFYIGKWDGFKEMQVKAGSLFWNIFSAREVCLDLISKKGKIKVEDLNSLNFLYLLDYLESLQKMLNDASNPAVRHEYCQMVQQLAQYPHKLELGSALLERYTEEFISTLLNLEEWALLMQKDPRRAEKVPQSILKSLIGTLSSGPAKEALQRRLAIDGADPYTA